MFPKEHGPTWVMGTVRTVPPKSGQSFPQIFGVAILDGHTDLPSDATYYWKAMYSQNRIVTTVYKMMVSLYHPSGQMRPSTESWDAFKTFISEARIMQHFAREPQCPWPVEPVVEGWKTTSGNGLVKENELVFHDEAMIGTTVQWFL
jgi:hypothetical protein